MSDEIKLIEIPLSSGEDVLEVNSNELPDDPAEIMAILQDERTDLKYWLQIAIAYYYKDSESFVKILETALSSEKERRTTARSNDTTKNSAEIAVLNALANYYLTKALTSTADSTNQDVNNLLEQSTIRVNQADKLNLYSQTSWLSKGLLYLARNNVDQALNQFTLVLQSTPDSLPATLGQAVALSRKGDWKSSLRSYQRVLKLLSVEPFKDVSKDVGCMVRLGIGICFEKLGMLNEAKYAFDRVLDLDKNNPSALISLATLSLNSVKDPSTSSSDRRQFVQQAVTLVKQAFDSMMQRGETNAVVYTHKDRKPSNNDSVLAETWYYIALSHHSRGQYTEAFNAYTTSLNYNATFLPSQFGIGQMYIQRQDYPKAIEALEAIRAKVKARNAKVRHSGNRGAINGSASTSIGDDDYDTLKILAHLTDLEVLLLYARLIEIIQGHSQEGKRKAIDVYEKAVDFVKGSDILLRPELLNNIATLKFQLGETDEAETLFTEALQLAVEIATPEVADALTTTISYNLARVYEESYKVKEASEIYEKLISKHPCYVDSHLRMASIAASTNAMSTADEHISTAITLSSNYIPAWASRANLQYRMNQIRPSRKTWEHILAKMDKYDIEALLELGNNFLKMAAKEQKPKEVRIKLDALKRSFEFFDKVLRLDPKNPYAANGIAIAVAEKGFFKEARSMFQQIRESNLEIPHMAVNLAHTLTELSDYRAAIVLYQQTLKKHFDNRDVALLNCIARAYYLLARSEKSIEYMEKAGEYVQRALHLSPTSLELQFDLALIQQQFGQLVLDLGSDKRTLELMQTAIRYIENANPAFAKLASLDREKQVPYDRRIADQREKHGDILKNKLLKKIEDQKMVEDQRKTRLDEIKRKREEEIRDEERRKMEEEERRLREQEEIEARRRELQERLRQEMDQEAELAKVESKNKRKKDKDGFIIPDSDASEDEEANGTEEKQKKKRRRKEKEKEPNDELGDGEVKKKRKLTRKTDNAGASRIDFDEDESAEPEAGSSKKRKKVLSSAIIEDSDEELAGEDM
ncbi:hypothetical protein BKA69DRAFT_1116312 [Paraphysoderma sedebokerense]|nr:hypothetical protein BKA69DRAFT_1116312 [Paraphysoderma sedebokerense]